MLIAVSTLVSIGLFTSPLWTNQSYFIYGILAAGIGLFAAIELMRTQYQLYSITNVNEPSKE
jgi:hypothetical protein